VCEREKTKEGKSNCKQRRRERSFSHPLDFPRFFFVFSLSFPGQPLGQQTLCDEQGAVLPSESNLEKEARKRNKSSDGGGAAVLALRAGGEGGASPVEPSPFAAPAAAPRSDGRVFVRIKPRVQLETWSLYWKVSAW